MFSVSELRRVLDYLESINADGIYINNFIITYWISDDKVTTSIFKILEEIAKGE